MAARLSALVDRWDRRENQMIAVLTQPDGDVTVTDGLDVNHTIPSFPSLQKQVAALVDELTGEVAGVREIATQVTALANAASDSAAASANSAEQASTSAVQAEASAGKSEYSAQESAQSAAASEVSRQASSSRADASATSAEASANSAAQAATSATLAGTEADDSAASASTALLALGDAQSARDLARAWAASPEDTEVQDGEFSAKHWAKKAQSFATGSLVYLGTWDASSNTLPSDAKKGAFYKIVGTGTISGVTYRSGDNIVHNGTDWDLIDNTETVTAVAGKVGNVDLEPADIAGLQAALDGKASVNHNHAIADVVNLQSSLDAKLDKAGGTLTGALTAPAFKSANLTGPAFYLGNDAMLVDIDRANCVAIQGQQDASTGALMLGGTTGPLLTGSTTNGLVVSSTKTQFNGTVIGTSPDNFRIVYGSYGTFWRNDNDTFYLMLTNANDPYGSWNGLRPLAVKLNSGLVSMGNGLSVTGRMRGDEIGIGASNRVIRLNNSNMDFEFLNQQYTAVVAIMHNDGTMLAPDFQIWSDRRLKDEIEPITFDAVSVLKKMPPRHYLKHNMNMEPIGYEYGFIHDEVEAVLPDATSRTEGTKDLPNIGSVASPQIVAVLAQAVLQLSERLDRAGIA